MNELGWIKEFPAAVTVCDEHGIILDLNDKAAMTFEKDGGRNLIGSNMHDCHPAHARLKTEALLASREKNVYTIEKDGIRKLIYTALDHPAAVALPQGKRVTVGIILIPLVSPRAVHWVCGTLT